MCNRIAANHFQPQSDRQDGTRAVSPPLVDRLAVAPYEDTVGLVLPTGNDIL